MVSHSEAKIYFHCVFVLSVYRKMFNENHEHFLIELNLGYIDAKTRHVILIQSARDTLMMLPSNANEQKKMLLVITDQNLYSLLSLIKIHCCFSNSCSNMFNKIHTHGKSTICQITGV